MRGAKIFNAKEILQTDCGSDFIGISEPRLEQWRAEVLAFCQVLKESGLTEVQVNILLNGICEGDYIKRTPQLLLTVGLIGIER